MEVSEDILEKLSEFRLNDELGGIITLGVGLTGVKGILEKDDNGFYVGSLRGGIKYYINNGDIITLESVSEGMYEFREYQICFV